MILLLVLTAAPALVPATPKMNASCLGAPVHLETDNVPVGNGKSTSVVNIWGFVDRETGAVVAWAYKNFRDEYYIQFNYKVPHDRFNDIPFANRIFAPPINGVYDRIVRLTPPQLQTVEEALSKKGVIRHACFTRDLRSDL